jgi:hypothetical protein
MRRCALGLRRGRQCRIRRGARRSRIFDCHDDRAPWTLDGYVKGGVTRNLRLSGDLRPAVLRPSIVDDGRAAYSHEMSRASVETISTDIVV